MEHSSEIAKLATALIAVQKKLEHAKKNAENPFFKSHYADLATVIDTSRDLLTANGLAVTQLVGGGPDVASVTTMLIHSSGEWLRDTVVGRPVKNDPQGVGSLITYLRRYSYQAIVGFSSEEDDDGNAASSPEPTKKPAERLSKDDTFKKAGIAIEKADKRTIDALAERLIVVRANGEITEEHYQTLVEKINNKRKELEGGK